MDNAALFKLHASLSDSLSQVNEELKKRNIDWQHLAEHGLVAAASFQYQSKYGCSLSTAVSAVRAFRNS